MICRSQIQIFFKFINLFLELSYLYSSGGGGISKIVLTNIEFIIILLMHL